MRVIHYMASGHAGGIEKIMADFAHFSIHENSFIFAWGAGLFAEKIKSYGCNTFVLDGHKIGNLRTIKKIIQITNQISPDVIIVHNGSPVLRVAAIISSYKYKLLVYNHCDARYENEVCDSNHIFKSFMVTRIKILINSIAARRGFTNIAISNYVANTMKSVYHIKDNDITTIYNGIDVEHFLPERNVEDETLKFIYVGRVAEIKGIQYSIKALSKLPRNIKWNFTIVGDGEYITCLKKLVDDLGLNQKIIFLGSRLDIPELLASADIFLHTCICGEGFGLGIVEAMASGKICICSDIGAIPEIISNNVEGLLVEPGNVSAILDKIMYVVTNKNMLDYMRSNAIAKSKVFSIMNFVGKLDTVISNTK